MLGLTYESPHHLVEFLTAVSRHEDASTAAEAAAELAAEEFDAEVGAVVLAGSLAASVGFGADRVPAEVLCSLLPGDGEIELADLGRYHVMLASWDAVGADRLIIARAGDEFAPEERNLLLGMGRGLGLTLRMIEALQTERSVRASLDERRRLLEALLDIQRAISHRVPLPEVLRQGDRGGEQHPRRGRRHARARRIRRSFRSAPSRPRCTSTGSAAERSSRPFRPTGSWGRPSAARWPRSRSRPASR